jgi:hypothetical protein
LLLTLILYSINYSSSESESEERFSLSLDAQILRNLRLAGFGIEAQTQSSIFESTIIIAVAINSHPIGSKIE